MNATGLQEAETLVARLRECSQALQTNIGRVIVGQKEAVRLLTAGLLCGGHMLLVGVPGLAKTLMVRTLAETLGWTFRRIQFTPDLMPADITGTEILEGGRDGAPRELVFHKGPVFAHLVLADEINRTPPKTQAALLEAMQEKSVTVSGLTHRLEQPFVVVATQNPIEQEGTYPLPEAQLDRFLFSLHLDYPEREEEIAIAARPARLEVPPLDRAASAADFLHFTRVIEEAPVSRHILEYAVALAVASRPKDSEADAYIRKYVAWGVGPRCSQHLILAAKAGALLDGRPSPEIRDVRAMALPVLRHRILPNYNALGEGIDAAAIVWHLLGAVPEPN